MSNVIIRENTVLFQVEVPEPHWLLFLQKFGEKFAQGADEVGGKRNSRVPVSSVRDWRKGNTMLIGVSLWTEEEEAFRNFVQNFNDTLPKEPLLFSRPLSNAEQQ